MKAEELLILVYVQLPVSPRMDLYNIFTSFVVALLGWFLKLWGTVVTLWCLETFVLHIPLNEKLQQKFSIIFLVSI